MADLAYITLKLEDRGYRVTPSRRAVTAAALSQTGHFTVDDLVTHCRGAGRATVFRTIRLLT
jgi:Fe2+ or Zn2+ uptake regulation protein